MCQAQILPFHAHGIAVDIVADPYGQNGEQISVVRNIKDDPLAGMLARRQIDQAQFIAGRTWQRYWEDSEIGCVRAVDPTKEPVDGKSPPRSPFTDKQQHAFSELQQVRGILGQEGNTIVCEILGQRVQLEMVAQWHARPKPYIGMRFRECLESMAKLWCYA